MRRSIRQSALVVGLWTSSACGLSVVGDVVTDPPPGADGGGSDGGGPTGDAPAPPVLDGASTPDASTDGPSPPADAGDGCVVVIDDTFTAQSPSWSRLGAAAFEPGQVVLTPKAASQAGAIWWSAPITFTGVLRIVLDYVVDVAGVPDPGDGLAVAWVDTSKQPALGLAAQSFGICNAGLVGTAVAADTKDGQLAVMSSVAQNCGTNGGVGAADAVGSTRLTAEVRAGSITGALGGGASRSRAMTLPTTGYLGITAATGARYSAHVATAIRVTSCP